MDCRVLWTSFWTCWTLLNTMHLFGALHLIQTDSTASHTGRRRLFLHELATQLLHGHASARFRTPKFLEVTKRRRTQKWARRSGIITAANGVSSSLGGVTDSNPENRCRRCRMCQRRKDRKTTECNTCRIPFCKQHSCVMTACRTWAEGGNERPRYQSMGGSRVWLLPQQRILQWRCDVKYYH